MPGLATQSDIDIRVNDCGGEDVNVVFEELWEDSVTLTEDPITKQAILDILEKEFGVPVAVNNDANCFALGAWRYGEGQGTNDMVGLTMGTGIGAGIIIGGKLYNGVNTGAGEIGSLPFKDADYEFYCSSRFFSKLHGDTGANFGKRAQAGDEDALAVWQEFGENVGELIKAVLFTYAPEAIIIGGGIASAFSLFETAMRKKLESFPYPENVAATRILPSTLPNAAMLGASILH